MIKVHTSQWDEFVQQVESIKLKSNREVLCLACWVLLNYEQRIKHTRDFPDHKPNVLTASKFASAP